VIGTFIASRVDSYVKYGQLNLDASQKYLVCGSFNHNDPTHHLYVEAAGVIYLRWNPERFIESNLDQSWLDYMENKYTQGTWADNVIIRGVASAYKAHIFA